MMGLIDADKKVHEIIHSIERNTGLLVQKVISEYVWYDSFTQLDKGWIDFS